ncbi:hypothetical protein KTT_28680 [Tengunoibacter tsumagoiensis]|uniref:Uncharacterized protein n=1 Tax=Tengunoibacter tsumagoiensis TaxID=2014871 RepID=A0A402A1T4_9CHLR|nr:hypothetical protein KTT_28680 [Tengunoibacter tsumagoiensis]
MASIRWRTRHSLLFSFIVFFYISKGILLIEVQFVKRILSVKAVQFIFASALKPFHLNKTLD